MTQTPPPDPRATDLPGAGAHELTLPEELVLLVYDDEKGTTWSSSVDTGLGGAVLLDLSLRGRLDVVEKDVVVTDPTPTGEPVLDAALAEVAAARRPKGPGSWLGGLGRTARPAALEQLVGRGVLREEQDRVLGLFRWTRYPESDGGPERRVRARLDDAVLHRVTPDARTAALASLVRALDLRGQLFPDADRRAVTARLEELSEQEWAGEAVRRSVEAMNVAVMTTVMTTTTSSSSSS